MNDVLCIVNSTGRSNIVAKPKFISKRKMANKFGQSGDGKAPTFFIPASYKGNQISKPTVVPTSNTSLLNNHITSPIKRTEPGRSTDSNTVGTNPPSHVSTNPTTNNNSNTRPGQKSADPNQSSYLLPSPSGVLDLSLYNFVPAESKPTAKTNGKSVKGATTGIGSRHAEGEQRSEMKDLVDSEVAVVAKEKKRRRFRRPRRNSKLDKLIRLLEDKRVGDDEENAEELEDLQMPRLRKVLNIIFVTLGVCFLLAVIIVIMYTTIATESDTLSEVCLHRNKPNEGCDNQTTTAEETSSDSTITSLNNPTTPSSLVRVDQTSSWTTPSSSAVHSRPGAHSYADLLPPPLPSLHNPPDVSISGYQTVTDQDPPDSMPETYTYPEPNRYEPIYSTSERNRAPYSWSKQRYSVDLDSGSIQEQLDTQNQWWPSSYHSQP